MTTTKNIIVVLLLCIGAQLCSMFNNYYCPKSLTELAWERHQEEVRQHYEKLGKPMPEQPTYEEAIKQHLRNKLDNDAAMHEEFRQRNEKQDNQVVKK
jgi:hypothetical protein